jgi:hypothetical protein
MIQGHGSAINPIIDSLAAALSPFAARLDHLYGKVADEGLNEAERAEYDELRGMARRLIASHMGMLMKGPVAAAAGEWAEGVE